MALNWAMIDGDGNPVPLPEEKVFLSVQKCQMSLDFKDQKAKWDAKGTAIVTNQRMVFIRKPALPPPADQSSASQHLRSLNVPLTHLVDCRYIIPILAGPYYEAGVLPVPGGNLPEPHQGGATVKGHLKIWFLEGGGTAFRDAVEEVRNLSRTAQHGEQLPAYQPTHLRAGPSGSNAPSVAATANTSAANSALDVSTVGGGYSGPSSAVGSTSTGGPNASRGASQLAPEDFEAAHVAMQQEAAEREAIRRQGEEREAVPGFDASLLAAAGAAAAAAPATSAGLSSAGNEEEPPAYQDVSPVTTFVRSSGGTEATGEGGQNPQVRARAVARSAYKILRTPEGLDRALQLCHGLALLVHHSFRSVRTPRSYGLFPIPHVFFFLFPRSLRRETLRRVHLSGEASEGFRRLALLGRWSGEGAQQLIARIRGDIKGKEKARESHPHTTPSSDSPVHAHVHEHHASDQGHSHSHHPPLSCSDRRDLDSDARREQLEIIAETLATICEALEVAAFVGGSSLLWSLLRGGQAPHGQRMLRHYQLHRLERLAVLFEVGALCLHLYVTSSLRRRLRRELGHAHRHTLLLTDELADAQASSGSKRKIKSSHGSMVALPALHDPSSSPQVESPPAASPARARASPSQGVIRRMLTAAEKQYQTLRGHLLVTRLEFRTHSFEMMYAVYELIFPHHHNELLEGWVELLAGGTGLIKAEQERRLQERGPAR